MAKGQIWAGAYQFTSLGISATKTVCNYAGFGIKYMMHAVLML